MFAHDLYAVESNIIYTCPILETLICMKGNIFFTKA
jgi:hypothetical protein